MATVSSKSFNIKEVRSLTKPLQFELEEIGDGQYIKREKMIKPKPENKATLPAADKTEDVADFTQIKGIGPASARSILAHGITTFSKLRTANIDFLPTNVQDRISEWRDIGDN